MSRKVNDGGLQYQTIYRALADDIRSGKYLNGTLLPTEAELMKHFAVSRTTIRRAIALLKDEKLVESRQGYGTEITGGIENTAPVPVQKKFKNIVDVNGCFTVNGNLRTQKGAVDALTADERMANILKVAPGSPLYRVQRIKMVGDQLYGYVISYVPADMFPGLDEYSGQISVLYQCLKDHYNTEITDISETISACSARFLESRLLDIPLQTPLLLLSRVAWTNGIVAEYAESYYRPDIYQVNILMKGSIDYSTRKDDVKPSFFEDLPS